MGDQLKIARNRMSYGAVKTYTRAEAAMMKAQQSGDPDQIFAAQDALDAFVIQYVESVPDHWFADDAPDEARAMGDGWLDWVLYDRQLDLRRALFGVPRDGEKKASATG